MLDELKHQGEIFGYANEHGWNSYFKLVNSVLEDIFKKNKDKDLILDLGGGTIASEFSVTKDNAELVKKNSKLILILPSKFDRRSLKIITQREHTRDKTGVNAWSKDWSKKKFEKKIKDDFNLRVPIFKKYAEFIVYTRFKSPKKVAENIMKEVTK
jgi:shikimate kinase